MLRRVASRVSMRSRERKLRLFLERSSPTRRRPLSTSASRMRRSATGSSDNFFEALYPWPERITAVGVTELDRFRAAFPGIAPCAPTGANCPSPTASSTWRSRMPSSSTSAAAATASARFVHELCRVAHRVFVTTPNSRFPLEVHSLVPSRTGCRGGARDRILRARGFDDVLEPLVLA